MAKANGKHDSSKPFDLAGVKYRVIERRMMPPREILDSPAQWREHSAAQAQSLLGVLQAIGITDSIKAWYSERAGGALVTWDGHLRKSLDPDFPWPIDITDLTDAEADYALLTHDPLGAMAGTDKAALDALLAAVDVSNQDVANMLTDLAQEVGLYIDTPQGEAPEAEPERGAELRQLYGVEPGQLWVLGDHRLICGDSADPAVLGRVVGDVAPVCLWTDPPYGVEYVGKTKDALTIQNDLPTDLDGLLHTVFGNVTALMEPGAPFYICHPGGPLQMVFLQTLVDLGWRYHEQLIWVKDTMVLGHSDYHYQHEPILYGWLPGGGRSGRGDHADSRWYGGNTRVSIFEIPRPKRSTEHPTMKPVALVEAMLQNSTRRAEVVLDPFCGSGATLAACARLGRQGRGAEISPNFVAVAIDQWVKMTGGAPQRAEDQP